MSKALVKESGDIVKHITVSFNFKLDGEEFESSELSELTFTHDSEPKEEGTYYNLSDGKEYHQKDLIVGSDEIRELNIN